MFALEGAEMARNDISQMALLIQPNCHDKAEFFSKSQKCALDCPPEPRKSAAAPQTDKPQWAEDVTSCCDLGDLRRISQCTQHLGPLQFNRTHTVLINVRSRWCQIWVVKSRFHLCGGSLMISVLPQVQIFNQEGRLVSQPGRDSWGGNFVKMPCSPSNIIYKRLSSKVCNRRRLLGTSHSTLL